MIIKISGTVVNKRGTKKGEWTEYQIFTGAGTEKVMSNKPDLKVNQKVDLTVSCDSFWEKS